MDEQGAGQDEKGVLPTLQARQAQASETLTEPGLSLEGASGAARRVIENDRDGGAPLVAADQAGALAYGPAGMAKPVEDYLPVEQLRGKTLLLVGHHENLPFKLERPLELARQYGFEVMLIDRPNQKENVVRRGLKPENFIAADIGTQDEAQIERIVEQIKEVHGKHPIHAVKTFINIHALLTAHLSEALGLAGNRVAAVTRAHEKDKAREIWNRDPSLLLPARVVRSAEEARAMFDEMRAAGYTHAVMKPASGGSGFLVKTDIGPTREDAAAAYTELSGALDRLVQLDMARARAKHMDKRPPILMEAQVPDIIPGRVPNLMLDVETLIQHGQVIYTNISYNPPSYQRIQETGSTYYRGLFESHPEIAAEIRRVATKAAMDLGLDGNAHLEASLTWHDGKPAVKMIEANARMGGKDIWENIRTTDGVDVIEQGILIAFNARADPRPKETPGLVQMRFIIPRWTGTIVSIEGIENLKEAGVWGEWEKKVGDPVEALPATSDYIGYFMKQGTGQEEGPALRDLLAALSKVKITIRTQDGALHEQTAAFGHEENHENFLVSTLLRELEGLQQSSSATPPESGFFARINAGLKQLPGSYYLYALGSGLLAMADEGISVIFAVYGITQFGLIWGLAAQATYIVFKAPGTLLAARWIGRFNSKRIFIATTIIKASMLIAVPILAALVGINSPWFLVSFLALQVMRGLIYGASRGMAESEILPKLVGQKKSHLQVASFLLNSSIEAFAMVAAFLSPAVQKIAGSSVAIGIFGALMLTSLFFFNRMKYLDAAAAAQKKKKGGTLERLSSRLEYIPFVAASFLHFAMYGILAGTFAKFVFQDGDLAGNTLGSYDAGSLAIGLIGGASTLIASEASKRTQDSDGFLERLFSLKTWFGLAVLAATTYLLTSVLGLSLLSYFAAALLGAMVILNRSMWMSSYQSRLKQELHARMISRLNSISIAVTLIPFAVITLGKILEASLNPLLWAITLGSIAALAVSWLLTREPKASRSN